MDTPFGRHYGPLQKLLDFALDEIPEAALTPEMVEAATWFNSWGPDARLATKAPQAT